MEDMYEERAIPDLRLLAWELTRRCNLRCMHCRAAANDAPLEGEIDKEGCIEIMKQIAYVSNPIIILTGGEPLLRDDIFDISAYGTEVGFRMVMATNGTLLDRPIIREMKLAGIKRVSISIDGPTSVDHDRFRGVDGAFEEVIHGIELLKEENLEFQINTTISRKNVEQLQDIMDLAIKYGASAHHIFLLVPTGRAKNMKDQQINAEEYEKLLRLIYNISRKLPIHVKLTCAPHYYRILREEAAKSGEKVDFDTYGFDAITRGCLGGIGFCFISYDGIIQPCGYLELNCGDLHKNDFDFIWNNSEVFINLRDFSKYKGKCSKCEYIRFCGGCRARAYEATGDYLAAEPLCIYVPREKQREESGNLNGQN